MVIVYSLIGVAIVLWPASVAVAYLKGLKHGYREFAEIWGGTILKLWRRAFGEAMPRSLWPDGTPEDSDERARRELVEERVDASAAALAHYPANRRGPTC
jgi:hypothetical protein